MRYEPHDYQVYAAEYIKNHDVAAVLLECGLGKTSITLTAINDLMFDSFEIHKVLVIAPIRVAKLSNIRSLIAVSVMEVFPSPHSNNTAATSCCLIYSAA